MLDAQEIHREGYLLPEHRLGTSLPSPSSVLDLPWELEGRPQKGYGARYRKLVPVDRMGDDYLGKKEECKKHPQILSQI